MLYLAEVQKKSRVIGSSKVEFKLLACQRSEHSWSAVSEELIAAPDDVPQNSGALVLVDLSASRQVQRYSDAGRQLVGILQNFSRLQEKFKTQEEEIEQWKQSLTYQSQELNRREMEIEARQEQLQQMEEDFEQLEQQRREVEAAQEEVNQLQEEFERKTQELEGAWAHLNGEVRRFEERKEEYQGAVGLSSEQAEQIQEIVNRLSGAVVPTEDLREQLNIAFNFVSEQQGALEQQQHSLDEERNAAQEAQDALNQRRQDIETHWHNWHQTQQQWIEAKAELSAQQTSLALKRETLEGLRQQLQQHAEIKKQLIQVAEAAGVATTNDKVDVEALQSMPLEQLQGLVQELRQEWEKNSRFVNSQEEELTLQQQEIENLKAKIEQASEYERLTLENELADEQESYRMLHETLVGQRRNVHERELILRKHEAILAQREGLPISDGQANDVDLEPVLNRLTQAEKQLTDEIEAIEQNLQQLEGQITELEQQVTQIADSQASALTDLKQQDHEVQDQRSTVAEQWGKVNTSQQFLQSIQDSLNGFKEKLEAIDSTIARLQESSDYQLQAMNEMQQVVQSLSSEQSPQLAAS